MKGMPQGITVMNMIMRKAAHRLPEVMYHGNAGGLEFGHLWHQKTRLALTRSAGRRTLEFGHLGGSHLECAGLTALSRPAALTQAPTADTSKKSQQAFQAHFEDKSLRNCVSKT